MKKVSSRRRTSNTRPLDAEGDAHRTGPSLDAETIQSRAKEILQKAYPAGGAGEPAPPASIEVEAAAVAVTPEARAPADPQTVPAAAPPPSASEPIPARMLNEFVYCPRLFYYEFVEGIFVESADTLRGSAIHQRVDSGGGALPAAKEAAQEASGGAGSEEAASDGSARSDGDQERIHSRSVQMGSDRLGVVAKMDLVEARTEEGDLFAVEVCPVDYKAGAPKSGEDANELWDADKMQLGLQALILRDNGYSCKEGIIYYRATKQRVRLAITAELEGWILERIRGARAVVIGPIPAPLIHSPKCVRCSLAPVCLPDETRMLTGPAAPEPAANESSSATAAQGYGRFTAPAQAPRRLIAARDDTRPLYLNTQGYRVGCKGDVLQVKEAREIIEEIRLRDLSHVALFGNIQVSTQAIQSLCQHDIPLSYFSMGGWFYGITRGHTLKNVFLRMEQFRLARDSSRCLELARTFVHGKIRNHRTMLMRNHVEPPAPALVRLKRAAEDALGACSIDELFGIEGAAAGVYFQQFNGMIKAGNDLDEPPGEGGMPVPPEFGFKFDFTHRNRRPPTDPINAMLSLAYSLLSKDCTLACLAVGFDPYVGFFHQPRFGRPALGLDLMEEFRPLLAESTVLSCINNRIVTEKDFVRAGKAVNLSVRGRKRFFQTYEQRMSSLITHPLFDYKVSYRRALELQARLLAKTLTGEINSYIPLLTR